MDNTLKIGCVVMAAGYAARFGENKLAASVNGKPLIEHALEAIPRESFSRVAASCTTTILALCLPMALAA